MLSPMRRLFFILGPIVAFLGLQNISAFAQTQSSANFSTTDSSVIPAEIIQSSGNYQIQAAINAIVGTGESAAFFAEIGSQTPPGIETAPPTPPAGGGGSAGIPPMSDPVLTLEYRTPTYLSTQKILGKKDSNIVRIQINGSGNGISIQGGIWSRQFPLFLGQNSIYLQGFSNYGLVKTVTGSVERLLAGDVNRDEVVGDADLSMLVHDWNTSHFRSDFNEDGVIDGTDLSIQFSYWSNIY